MSEKFQVLEERRLRRQADREAVFAALEQRLNSSTVRKDILDLGHKKLIAKLQSRELKAVEVLEAFVWKSLEVTRRCNCITEFHPQMMDWADELDALDKPKGPLHGLPFCVKDDHDLVGMDTTVGCSYWLEKPAKASSVTIQVLVDAGAIPFCKTNSPQGAFSYGSSNPIFGETSNPWDKQRAPGGSSVGTGALVAAGGCLFGTGSDTGGSTRIPAHFCGVPGMLQTQFRNSVRGMRNIAVDESGGLHGQICVLAANTELMAKIYQILWESKAQSVYDPNVAPAGWNSEEFTSSNKYTIGYFASDPYFPAIGDTAETVLNAKSRLEALGHTLVPFQIPDLASAVGVYCTLACGTAAKARNILQNDEIATPTEKFFPDRYPPPQWVTKRAAAPHPRAGETEVNWDHLKLQRAYRDQILDSMKEQEIDLLLTPAFPFAACGIKDCETLFAAASYTCHWNLVGFPAAVVPFGTETGAKIEEYDDEGDDTLKKAKESLRNAQGLPIGVQIVGKPWNDEVVLKVATQLEPFSTFKKPEQA